MSDTDIQVLNFAVRPLAAPGWEKSPAAGVKPSARCGENNRHNPVHVLKRGGGRHAP